MGLQPQLPIYKAVIILFITSRGYPGIPHHLGCKCLSLTLPVTCVVNPRFLPTDAQGSGFFIKKMHQKLPDGAGWSIV